MPHAVEVGGFDHGVVCHVLKDQLVSDRERAVKCIVANHVTGQAGDPPESIPIGALSGGGFPVQRDVRAVGHLKDVRHVGGGRNIENGDTGASVFKKVEDAGMKGSGMQDGCLARFEPDLVELVACSAFFDEAQEVVPIVVLFSNQVTTTEVEPAELLGIEGLTEMLVDRFEGYRKGIAALLAEGVKVQSAQSGEVGPEEVVRRHSEAGAGGARVVKRGSRGRALGVDPQAEPEFPGEVAGVGKRIVAPVSPMIEGVEVEVGTEIKEFPVGIPVSRSAGKNRGAAELVCELSLPEARGTESVKILAQKQENAGQGEGLERMDDPAAGISFETGQNLAVSADGAQIDDIGWRGDIHGAGSRWSGPTCLP